jgi:Icc-related predicted phosphoesterase
MRISPGSSFRFQDAWATTGRRLVALHGEAFTVGPATVIGFPCLMGDETAFVGERQPLPANPNSWLSRLLEKHGPSMRTLWLMHEPPSGTPLSQPNSPVEGNRQWRTAIDRFRPILTISGHDIK